MVDQDSAPRRAWRWGVLLNVEDLYLAKSLLRKPSPAGKWTRAMASPADLILQWPQGVRSIEKLFMLRTYGWHGQCHWLARTVHFQSTTQSFFGLKSLDYG